MNKRNPYKVLLETFGEEIQYQFAIEEMGELLQAISKYKRKISFGDNEEIARARQNLQEEIADVLIIAEQLAFMFDEKEIQKIKRKKIERALVRAENKNTEFEKIVNKTS